jgi:hypothetical protein
MHCNTGRAEYDRTVRQFMIGEFVFDVRSLYAHLEQLTDRRDRRGVRYGLADVLALIILAKLGGEDSALGIAEWLKHRAEALVRVLKLPRASMPHAVTISRILGRGMVAEELEQTLHHYVVRHRQAGQSVLVAIDGKTLRGTIEVGQSHGVHLLAAYLPEEGVVLMQVEVGQPENEIVAAPRLLQVLDLRGKVVIGDAMHTQRPVSIDIVRAGGAYVWTAKGNQAAAQATIAYLFAPEAVRPGFAATVTDCPTASAKSLDRYGFYDCPRSCGMLREGRGGEQGHRRLKSRLVGETPGSPPAWTSWSQALQPRPRSPGQGSLLPAPAPAGCCARDGGRRRVAR